MSGIDAIIIPNPIGLDAFLKTIKPMTGLEKIIVPTKAPSPTNLVSIKPRMERMTEIQTPEKTSNKFLNYMF